MFLDVGLSKFAFTSEVKYDFAKYISVPVCLEDAVDIAAGGMHTAVLNNRGEVIREQTVLVDNELGL